MMKKLISLTVATLTVAMQGVAFAQTNQGSPISEKEYRVVVKAVCQTSGDPNDLEKAVVSIARRNSVNSQKVEELQEIAVQMFSLPQIEKDRICMS